jgi:hypothetical protein
MRFTQSQLAPLHPHAEEGFVERVAAHLGDRHPALVAGIGPGDLADQVRAAIAKGRSHRLTWESSLAWFAVLTFALGPGFDEHPAVEIALQPDDEDDADETERIQALSEAVSAVDWEES